MTSPPAAPLFHHHSPCHHRSPRPALLSHTSVCRCARQLNASRRVATMATHRNMSHRVAQHISARQHTAGMPTASHHHT
jgi:hypothetical protein